jgi:MoaA/NifB/PqqE/SkfB family radical SAM enzyme
MSKYVLDEVVLRKEFFGGIVVALTSNTCHQINQDSFKILCKLKKPLDLLQLQYELNKDNVWIEVEDLQNFLNDMINLNIITSSNKHKGALVFFENEDIMRKDCLRAPTSVSFHITQFCPKECKHCVTDSSPYVDRSTELTPETWFRVIEKLRDFGCSSIVFTGGDCLAKEQIFDILRKADQEKFLIGVLTDYDGINHKHIQQLKELKHLVDLQVSLDGGTLEIHDWMRGNGAFKKALRRMRFLQENGMNYTVSATIHKNNINELEAIADITNQFGATNLYVSPLCPYGRGKFMTQYILSDKELRSLGQKYLSLIKHGIVNPGNPYWLQNLHRLGDEEFHPFKYSLDAVSTGFFNLSVDWKGDCFLDTKFRSENVFSFGNVVKDNIHDIWFNPRLNAARMLSNPESVYVYQSDLMRYLA